MYVCRYVCRYVCSTCVVRCMRVLVANDCRCVRGVCKYIFDYTHVYADNYIHLCVGL